MKKKNGFTLIELLAVIVILAVIALIATPLIMNTINDARDSAMQRSVQNIRHAAEQHLMSKKVLDSNYTFNINNFDYKGEKYDKLNIAFNDKDEAGVSVYKGKCFYVLAGSNNVIIDEDLEEADCLVKVGKPGKQLVSAIVKQENTSANTTEGFKSIGNGTYQYVGASGTGGTNWLWYGGHLWRIMKVNSNDNTMELITSSTLVAIGWGSSVANMPSLETSYVGKWLNEVFLTSLPIDIQDSLVPMTYTRNVYNGSSVISEEISDVKVRLLTEAEYTGYSGKDKYLDIKDFFWLADIYDNKTVYEIDYDGYSDNILPPAGYGVRPVVKVSELTFTNGDGTLTNPYIASTSNAKMSTDIAVGEYVSIPKKDGTTYLARVVSQNGGTKVLLNGVYSWSYFGDSTIFSKTSTVYTEGLTPFKGTLDSTYFDNSDKLYNITRLGSIGDDYSLNTTTVQSDIGLPSLGEMFSGNDIDLYDDKVFVDENKISGVPSSDYWLMNSSDDSEVYFIHQTGEAYRRYPDSSFGVRPTWYIEDVEVTGGNGTANDPYTLK